MIITHRIIEGGHELSVSKEDAPQEIIMCVQGGYEKPIFLYMGARTLMALSAHFKKRAGVYQIESLVPISIATKELTPLVQNCNQKQEYNYDS